MRMRYSRFPLTQDRNFTRDEIVVCIVGREREVILVHQELLWAASHIMKEITEAAELQDGMTIASVDPTIFQILVEYLYTKEVDGVHPLDNADMQQERLTQLCELYCFLNRFDFDHEVLILIC